jgi:hypothetical protein
MLVGGAIELETVLGPLEVGRPLTIEFGGGDGTAILEETTSQRTFRDVPTGASLC